jgi:regulator of sigma E protease
VLAFAMGFGGALLSFRKGLGLRIGSSEPEYNAMLRAGRADAEISPTEYRLNWLPFGGYVKMLGQDDSNPAAVSDAPDSYQSCPVWKRMIVISAGVVMNVIAAAVLFMIVFMNGLQTEPARIGLVAPGKPASLARVISGAASEPGLRPGDNVIAIDGKPTRSFNDLAMAAAMGGKNRSLLVSVDRPGTSGILTFEVTPEASPQTRLLEIGVSPSFSAKLLEAKTPEEAKEFGDRMAEIGLNGLKPGMTLTRVGSNASVTGAADLVDAVERADGSPVEAEFRLGDEVKVVQVRPRALLQTGLVKMGADSVAPIEHLLGLTPLMKVAPSGGNPDAKPQQGLKEGDIFARIGSIEYPGLAAGIAEIHRNKGKQIAIEVLRPGHDGLERIRITPDPTVRNKGEGQIGFLAGETADDNVLLSLPPAALSSAPKAEPQTPAAASLITRPGTRILTVAGRPVADFTQLRAALRDATAPALASGALSVDVPMRLELPVASGKPTADVSWKLTRADIQELHKLGWASSLPAGYFEMDEFLLKAQGPNAAARAADAVKMGLSETRRVMAMTYLTFARLFDGTVKVEHLKGPVGIAHMGTRIAERGMIWLLFFMGLISINLAVVNFLPLPIVDGGQFIFLLIEQVRGKPVSVEIQSMATIAGLVLIGAIFLVVTFQDIANLLG